MNFLHRDVSLSQPRHKVTLAVLIILIPFAEH